MECFSIHFLNDVCLQYTQQAMTVHACKRIQTYVFCSIGQPQYLQPDPYQPAPNNRVVSIPEGATDDFETEIQSPGYLQNQRGKRSLSREDTERIES